MRWTLRVLAALLIVMATPVVARAQTAQTTQTQPPQREDVILQGKVLRPDGSPAANTPVRVDTSSGFGFFNFFATLGLSTLACFGGENELCPIQSGHSWETVTDKAGHYSFTFKNAHRVGEQTDTDYTFSVGLASTANPKEVVVGSYELELLTHIHNAPDIKLWDPTVSLEPAEHGYKVSYPPRANSQNNAQLLIGDREDNKALRNSIVDAREVEDSSFSVVPRAFDDVANEGTIYHQRFRAAGATRRGTLIPISRGAACTAVRKDGTRLTCGATDGDLSNPSVVEPQGTNVCDSFDYESRERGFQSDCVEPVTEITIDMDKPKSVGEVRARCNGCEVTASADGATWTNLPYSGVLNTPHSYRYIRLSSKTTLQYVPEVSVWPSDDVKSISPLPDKTGDGVQAISPSNPSKDDDSTVGHETPWGQMLLGFAIAGAGLFAVTRKRG